MKGKGRKRSSDDNLSPRSKKPRPDSNELITKKVRIRGNASIVLKVYVLSICSSLLTKAKQVQTPVGGAKVHLLTIQQYHLHYNDAALPMAQRVQHEIHPYKP